MMKSNKMLLALCLSLICIFAMTFLAYGEEKTEGIIIGSDVNIRKMPNTESEVVGQLQLGEVAQVLSHNGNWYSISTSDVQGWILNDLIIVDESKDPIKTGIITTDSLNVRKEPTTESDILCTISKESEVTITSTGNDWYQISIDQSQNGWIHSDYVKIKPNYSRGKIIGDNVHLRSQNSMDSDIITQLSLEAYVYIQGYSQEWYKVLTYDGQEGWIHKDLISVVINDGIENTVSRSANRTALKIVSEGKKLLGIPYRYGSSGPKSFDCSGFTSYVFKKAGIELPRTSKTQATVGKKVSKSDLQAGDLVFFDTSGKYNGVITHVGIYIGGGQFIHASSGRNAKKVVISDINTGYYNEKFVTARRVF